MLSRGAGTVRGRVMPDVLLVLLVLSHGAGAVRGRVMPDVILVLLVLSVDWC